MLIRHIFGRFALAFALTLSICIGEEVATGSAQETSAKAEPSAPAGKLPPDIENAMQTASQMQDEKDREKAVIPPALEWVKKDPISALVWAHQLPLAFKKVRESVDVCCGETHGEIGAKWTIQKKAYGEFHKVMHGWATTDPAAAIEWSKQAPEEVRHIAFCSLGDTWSYKDPSVGTALFLKLTSLDDRRSLAYGICKGWTWALPKDALAATTWAMGLKSQEERISALYGIGQGWSRYYLLETTAWIKTLKSKEDVKAATYGVVKMIQTGMVEIQKTEGRANGAAQYKADYAKEWLDQFPLSDPEKTYILNGPAIGMKDPGKIPWPQ